MFGCLAQLFNLQKKVLKDKFSKYNLVWWCMPITPAFGKLKKKKKDTEDCNILREIKDYISKWGDVLYSYKLICN